MFSATLQNLVHQQTDALILTQKVGPQTMNQDIPLFNDVSLRDTLIDEGLPKPHREW
jgi:hypothetical protein